MYICIYYVYINEIEVNESHMKICISVGSEDHTIFESNAITNIYDELSKKKVYIRKIKQKKTAW